MACTPAPSCQAALIEATRRWPGRRTSSDGICPSPEHYARNPGSDHSQGEAWDLSHDPVHGCDCHRLSELVKNDPRVKYVIWNRRIWNPSISRTWRDYSGDNPHTQHMHVSIKPEARKDIRPWFATQQQKGAFMALTDKEQKELLEKVRDIDTQLAEVLTHVKTGRNRVTKVLTKFKIPFRGAKEV